MKEQTMKEKMLRGSAWMTAGSIISRILGALYIIPWYSWFGSDKLQANALYTNCLLYTSPSPRDGLLSRMPSSA